MQLFTITLIITLGLLIGSFLNVCIYRIPKNESIAFPPSHCFSCGRNLTALDLVPVLSYIFLRGKCRRCKAHISIQYPLIELANGLLYLLLFTHFGLTLELVFFVALTSILIVISVTDYYHKIIHDSINLTILVVGIIYNLTIVFVSKGQLNLLDSLLGFALGGGLFLMIAILTGAMGGGDIKMMGALGIWFGVKGILLVSLLSFVIGSIVMIFLLITKIKGRKDEVPFGPFICIATLVTMLYRAEIIEMYIKFITSV